MRLPLLLAALLLLSPCVGAQTIVTFNAATDRGGNATSSDSPDTMSKDGITISCTYAMFGNGSEYRFYTSSNTTVSSSVGNITEVVFHCTGQTSKTYGPSNFKKKGDTNISSGSYKYSGTKGTWTGNAAEFTIKGTVAQLRATQIDVTVDTSTGVKAVEASSTPRVVYNLQGQRVARGFKGLAIVDGRKVMTR